MQSGELDVSEADQGFWVDGCYNVVDWIQDKKLVERHQKQRQSLHHDCPPCQAPSSPTIPYLELYVDRQRQTQKPSRPPERESKLPVQDALHFRNECARLRPRIERETNTAE